MSAETALETPNNPKQPPAQPLSPQPEGGAMLRTLGIVSVVSGLLIVLAYQLSLPYILENRRHAIESAIFKVVPGATARVTFGLDGDKLVRIETGNEAKFSGPTVYGAYDAGGNLTGIALEGAAQGYQDTVRTLYGYSPTCRCIIGLTVVETKETPGLGDNVDRNPEFMKNFISLDAKLNEAGTALANPIVTVKHGKKQHPWQIDAISGATVTSKAIGKGLNDSAQAILPIVAKNLDMIMQEKSSPAPASP